MRLKGHGTPGTFSQDYRSQAFEFAKMASAPKKPRQTLQTLNVFFESAFEYLSFHSFLKASD